MQKCRCRPGLPRPARPAASLTTVLKLLQHLRSSRRVGRDRERGRNDGDAVFLTGGTGLIGRRIVQRPEGARRRADHPLAPRRGQGPSRQGDSGSTRFVQGDPSIPGGWEESIVGCDAVINLAGHNLFAARWYERVKPLIRDSRVHATEQIVKAIAAADYRPKALVQASAIGYDGPHGDAELTAESPVGSDFMARVCREWEEAAKPPEGLGVRLATVRTGVVLAKGDGALGVMTPIFKWVPGGAAPVGSGHHPLGPGKGEQWMSWIHLDDIVGIFLLALDNPGGTPAPINGASPNPVTNADFARALGKTLRNHPWMPIGPPDFGLPGQAWQARSPACHQGPEGSSRPRPRPSATTSSTPHPARGPEADLRQGQA